MKRRLIRLLLLCTLLGVPGRMIAFGTIEMLPVNRDSVELSLTGIGSNFQIVPELRSEAGEYVFRYGSEDEGVASVTANGWICAAGQGQTFITVQTSLGREAIIDVRVREMPLTTFPIRLEEIASEAFRGAGLERALLPEGLVRIGEYAFADNRSLHSVFIPSSVQDIGEGAFDGDGELYIICDAGSYAQQWASRHGIVTMPLSHEEHRSVTSIISPGDITIDIGSSVSPVVTVLPESAENRELHWSSSNPSVASVSSDGRITGLAAGRTTMTIQAMDGSGVSTSFVLTVRPNAAVGYSPYFRQSIDVTNAVLARTISVSGNVDISDVTQVGCELFDENGVLLGAKREIPYPKDGVINAWYDVNAELGVVLMPGTGYRYRFVAVVGGTEYYSEMDSFTTLEGATEVSVSFSANSHQVIGSTNATVARTISVSGASIDTVSEVGCCLYDENWNWLGEKREPPTPLNGVINAWYDVRSELGVTLEPGRVYRYRFMATVQGTDYYDDYDSFMLIEYIPNSEKIQAVVDRAFSWVNYTWTAPVDIPVYNNLYNESGEVNYYQTEYYFMRGTEMHGLPYTLSNSKYNLERYAALSDTAKAASATFTYSNVLMWGPRYAADCSELVSDCLYFGDPAIGTDGQTYFTSSKAYLYETISWDEIAPGDALGKPGHTMIVVDVAGDEVTTVEQCGNGDDSGALHCRNPEPRVEGGYYVCGACEACAGENKGATVLRTRTKGELSEYTVYRYLPLYQ